MSALDGDILVALARITAPVTGRKVATLSQHGSQTGVNRRLRVLVEQGIVEELRGGNARLYSLNRRHIAAPAVELLASLRETLFQRIRKAIEGWSVSPHHVSVFGSAARGDGGVQSDIDMLVVQAAIAPDKTAVWREQLSALARDVLAWTGNHLAIAELRKRELPQLVRRMPPALAEARRDAVTLYGPSVEKLLRGPRA